MTGTPWRKKPVLYETNTWVWLWSLSQQHGTPITLGSVPDSALDALAAWGFDAIWLMGVWERSAAAQQVAVEHPGLQAEYRAALPDYQPADVVGSPYAIHQYTVDTRLGGRAELAALREKLTARGLKLILDFVPNHVAIDHPWTETHPECFIQGTQDDLDQKPDYFFQATNLNQVRIYANGRDPYFPAWTDTAQLNAFSPVLRAKAVDTLQDIASQCDGVRCDMAMLMTNKVFAQTWGERAGQVPSLEYWEVVIPAVRAAHPDFLFMAEVYWDMEWDLLKQGFNYAYDKRLYDRMRTEPVRSIIAHLYADLTYQQQMVRFIENHDEKRAAIALGPGRDLACAVLIATLPGATLIHEGQMVGRQIKLPVQLGRRVLEPDNTVIEALYRLLLNEVRHSVYHEGEWKLRECGPAWDLNASHRALIAYTWCNGEDRRLVAVNFTPTTSQARIALPDFDLAVKDWILRDELHQMEYERDGAEMAEHGLYIDLGPWQSHLFCFKPKPVEAKPAEGEKEKSG
jgi:hypothetical protein